MYFCNTKMSDVTPPDKKSSAFSASLPFLTAATGGSGSIIGYASSSFPFVFLWFKDFSPAKI